MFMAQKKEDITPEEFRELMHEIIKRIIIAGVIVSLVGVLIILIVFLTTGGFLHE